MLCKSHTLDLLRNGHEDEMNLTYNLMASESEHDVLRTTLSWEWKQKNWKRIQTLNLVYKIKLHTWLQKLGIAWI